MPQMSHTTAFAPVDHTRLTFELCRGLFITIHKLREGKEMSNTRLAILADMRIERVSSIWEGYNPDLSELCRLAHALDTSPWDLLERAAEEAGQKR